MRSRVVVLTFEPHELIVLLFRHLYREDQLGEVLERFLYIV